MGAAVGDLFDVQIVAYVRRQDDFILSSWYQWWLKTHDSFESYLAECVGKHGDWAKRMSAWEEAFGRARIVVRRFQRSALVDGDVAADFLSVTGLPSRGLRLRQSLANPSVSEHLGALAHRSRDLFTSPHDRGPYGDIDFAAGEGAAKTYRGSILLSLEARQAILEAYEESNRLLRERYFPNLPAGEPLFEPPTAEDVVTLGDTERLQCQQDILFRSVVGLSRHVRRLEGELQTLAKQRRQKKRRRKRPILRRLLRKLWGNHR